MPKKLVFVPAGKTRMFSVQGGTEDRALCQRHAQARIDAGEELGVPSAAKAYMFRTKPWPTGDEPCEDCP